VLQRPGEGNHSGGLEGSQAAVVVSGSYVGGPVQRLLQYCTLYSRDCIKVVSGGIGGAALVACGCGWICH
jgi:hypothetical protein